MNYGYVRVSSKDQNIARQVVAMEQAGLDKKRIYIDKQSGKDFERLNYKRLIKKMKKGDVLFLKSIDRLGRNYDDIIDQWRYLIKEKDIDIVVLDFPLLNTTNQVNGLTGKFIADLVLQILSYTAQIERENIHQRQAEGIRVARANGVRFGRPKSSIPKEFGLIYMQWCQNEISKRQASKLLNTNHFTFSRWVERYENELINK